MKQDGACFATRCGGDLQLSGSDGARWRTRHPNPVDNLAWASTREPDSRLTTQNPIPKIAHHDIAFTNDLPQGRGKISSRLCLGHLGAVIEPRIKMHKMVYLMVQIFAALQHMPYFSALQISFDSARGTIANHPHFTRL